MENMTKKKSGVLKWILIGLVVIIIVICIVAGKSGESDDKGSNNNNSNNDKNKVTITDFSSMTEAEIDTWCNNNKVKCTISNEYSDTVSKGSFISQSVEKDKVVYENEKITIVFSKGKEPTSEQKNALKKAESYSKTMHMSKQGIYNQLTSTIEGFDKNAAQYAIDNIEADWKANALEKAKSYQKTMNMSKQGIYNQLTSTVEGFTKEEAQYAIDHLDD